MYSKEQAIEILHREYFKNEANLDPKNFADIDANATIETSFGWIFFYNNALYLKTRNQMDAWVGPGPILFDKFNGFYRHMGSGSFDAVDFLIEDYEKEKESVGGSWILRPKSNDDFKKNALAIRKVLDFPLRDCLDLVKNSEHYLWAGKWRDLKNLKLLLEQEGAQLLLEVRSTKPPAAKIFSPDTEMYWKLRKAEDAGR